MRLSLAFKNNTFTYGFQKHKGNHGLNFSLFFSLWFCTYNAITLMKTRGRTLSVHTCRVHFHKLEQPLATGLPFLSCQDYFTTSIYVAEYYSDHEKTIQSGFQSHTNHRN